MDSIHDYIVLMEGLDEAPVFDPSAMPSLFVSAESAPIGSVALPSLCVESYSWGLDRPIDNGLTSAAIVDLLCKGDASIYNAAQTICQYDYSDDDKAMSVVYFVSNVMSYVGDGGGVGDRWTAALATWLRKYGDCEDGAILIHALLLAAGVDPGRLRTAFGLVVTSALVESGHAWVMYRRLTDEEWIPLEWTIQTSPYDIEASQIKRQVDLTDSYTAISYILTDERFYQVADANYIANLAANRSTGEATLSALAATGTVGISSWAALTLPTATATGRCGARASATFLALTTTGTARETITARGEAVIPSLAVAGETGATGDMALAKLKAVGTCGTSARGKANFPALAMDAFAWVENLAWGGVYLPKLGSTGRAVQGGVAVGAGTLQSLHSTGRAAQCPIARGGAMIPRLQMVGSASPLLVAVGNVDLPPLLGRGHAINAASWTNILSYDATRLA